MALQEFIFKYNLNFSQYLFKIIPSLLNFKGSLNKLIVFKGLSDIFL